MASLTRRHLAELVADLLELPRDRHWRSPKAKQIVDAVIAALVKGIRTDKHVSIYGLGRFRAKQIPAKVCHRPFVHRSGVRSPEPRIIPARQEVEFIPTIDIRAELNKSTPNSKEHISLQKKAKRDGLSSRDSEDRR